MSVTVPATSRVRVVGRDAWPPQPWSALLPTMSNVRSRHTWAMDLTEADPGASRADLPKPPGYTETHAQELDESKVAVRKVDQMQLKLKVTRLANAGLRWRFGVAAGRTRHATHAYLRACTCCVRRKRESSLGRPVRTL